MKELGLVIDGRTLGFVFDLDQQAIDSMLLL